MNMNKETKYKKTYNLTATIISIIITIVFLVILIYAFNYVINAPITETGFFQTKMAKVFPLFIICFFFIFIVSGLIGSISGIIKGRKIIIKENKYIKKMNPYLYYRELPNSFGIGVTTLLFDSTIENYKDIVAVILDLCARKYLHLIKQNDKYIIKVLKGIDNNLLNNEKYIMSLILNNNIKNLNYKKWFDYCMQDGIDLGLYYHGDAKINAKPLLAQDIMKKRKRTHFLISLISAILVFLLFSYTDNLITAIGYGIFWFVLSYVVLIIPFYLLNVFTGIVNIAKQTSHINYQNAMNNKLTRTKKGIEELQKLYSFKEFIKDLGHFVDKKPDEVILWDRYLSYAQVFGLTKEIMNYGYNQIIDNSSFQIDTIDNINLYNIEVK